MRKTLWIFLLALGLIFALAACGADTTPAPEEPSPAEVTAAPETEEVTEEDSDAGPGQATEISMGTLTDSLDEGAEDWHAFEVPDGHVLSVSFTAGDDAKGLNVHLFDPDQNELWQEWDVGSGETESVEIAEVAAGTYSIRVSGGSGSYTVQLD
ncbi:MAG: pre-peptidase C-terminal domain-containing protein [Chloroflexota bacterium]